MAESRVDQRSRDLATRFPDALFIPEHRPIAKAKDLLHHAAYVTFLERSVADHATTASTKAARRAMSICRRGICVHADLPLRPVVPQRQYERAERVSLADEAAQISKGWAAGNQLIARSNRSVHGCRENPRPSIDFNSRSGSGSNNVRPGGCYVHQCQYLGSVYYIAHLLVALL